VPLEKLEFENDIIFIGGKNKVREWYISELHNAGLKVRCFGFGWPEGKLSYEQMVQITRRSKISLNLSNSIPKDFRYYLYLVKQIFRSISFGADKRFAIASSLRIAINDFISSFIEEKAFEQIKARNFEIPAHGGFQISQYALGLDDYFIPGKEIVLFSTVDELIVLIKYYLFNTEERERIRFAGYERSKMHTYALRIKKIFQGIDHDQGLHNCE